MIEQAIEYLNSLLEDDREAIEKLIESRVNCNEALANHPTCEVGLHPISSTFPVYCVGLLGVINGMLKEYNDVKTGPICAVYDKDYNLVKFERYKEDNMI